MSVQRLVRVVLRAFDRQVRRWNEGDYVRYYYGGHRRDDDSDVLKGVVVGAAVVGVAVAIANSND